MAKSTSDITLCDRLSVKNATDLALYRTCTSFFTYTNESSSEEVCRKIASKESDILNNLSYHTKNCVRDLVWATDNTDYCVSFFEIASEDYKNCLDWGESIVRCDSKGGTWKRSAHPYNEWGARPWICECPDGFEC